MPLAEQAYTASWAGRPGAEYRDQELNQSVISLNRQIKDLSCTPKDNMRNQSKTYSAKAERYSVFTVHYSIHNVHIWKYSAQSGWFLSIGFSREWFFCLDMFMYIYFPANPLRLLLAPPYMQADHNIFFLLYGIISNKSLNNILRRQTSQASRLPAM